MINRALSDNSMAVTRAMHPWHPREDDRERQVERVMTRYEDGSFLINRLGAEGVIDQDLVVVLLDLSSSMQEDMDTPKASAQVMPVSALLSSAANGFGVPSQSARW